MKALLMKFIPLFLILVAVLATGCQSVKPRVPFDSVAYRPDNPASVRVKVSVKNMMVYVMEGDRALLVTPTCVGKPGSETPLGRFRVNKKIARKRSYTYGFYVKDGVARHGKSSHTPRGWRYVGYPMPYWVEFKPAYGFHTGYVHPIPRTHGCLRLHRNVAPKFFELVRVGTPVHIAYTQPEDATLGRNVPRPEDYVDPDPPNSYMITSAPFTAHKPPVFANEASAE